MVARRELRSALPAAVSCCKDVMSAETSAATDSHPTTASAGAGSTKRFAVLGWVAAFLLALVGTGLRLHDIGGLSVVSDEIYTIWETRSARKAADAVDGLTAWQQRLDQAVANDPKPPAGVPENEQWRLRWGYRTNPFHLLANECSFWLFGDTPFAARLSSLLFGLAALFAFPLLARGLWGDRAALLLLAVLALAPDPIEFSRLARYQSACFFFGGIAALAAARFTRHRRLGDELLCLVACAGLVASHLTGILVAGTLYLWLALCVRGRLSLLLLLPAAAIAGAAWWIGPHHKVSATIDAGIVITSGYRWWQLAASLVYNFGPGLIVLAAAAALLPRERGERKPVVALLIAGALPAITLFWLNRRNDIGPRYFASIEAIGVLVAALGVDRLLSTALRPLLGAALAALLLLAQLPLLLSNYVDGQRYPYAQAATRLQAELRPDDRLVCDWSGILDYYFDATQGFSRRAIELPSSLPTLEERLVEGHPTRAFLVLPRQRGRFVWPGRQQVLQDWLLTHARPFATLGETRLDSALNRFGAGYHFELVIFTIDLDALRQDRGG